MPMTNRPDNRLTVYTHPRINSAWRAVRQSHMTNDAIAAATGLAFPDMQEMRQHWHDMREMGVTPSGQWEQDRQCFPAGCPIYRRP